MIRALLLSARWVYLPFFFILLRPAFTQPHSALEFNGGGTYAFVPRHNAYNSARITLECWFKPYQCLGRDRWDAILNKPYTVHQDPYYQWLFSRTLAGGVAFSLTIEGVWRRIQSRDSLVVLNRWHHLAGTYDGRVMRLFLNGQEVASLEVQGNISPYNTDLFIGRLGNVGVDYYNGVIDEIRIWNFARNIDDIRRTMNSRLIGNEQGLVGYFRLDEGEGQRIADSSPTRNNGRLGDNEQADNNDPRWVETDLPLYGGELQLSDNRLPFGPVLRGEDRQLRLVLRNTSPQQDQWARIDFSFQDQEIQPRWLTIQPRQGTINPGEEMEIIFIANAGNLNPSLYRRTIVLTANARNLQRMEIPAWMEVVEGRGRFLGIVTDLETGQPLERARVEAVAEFALAQITDDQGRFDFNPIPAYRYVFQVWRPPYHPIITDTIIIRDGEEIERDFALRYSS
ncbi:MAG: LamG-like jellyroll fold domain-containing protein, partial [bacterium]